MLIAIKDFFANHLDTNTADDDVDHRLRLASAALLIEIARADFHVDDTELQHILDIQRETLDLEEDEIAELVKLAEQESHESTSLHGFTRLVHEHYSAEQKLELLQLLWRVAYADGRLDQYEEYTLRKIAELLYIPHSDFIQTKHRAQAAMGI